MVDGKGQRGTAAGVERVHEAGEGCGDGRRSDVWLRGDELCVGVLSDLLA